METCEGLAAQEGNARDPDTRERHHITHVSPQPQRTMPAQVATSQTTWINCRERGDNVTVAEEEERKCRTKRKSSRTALTGIDGSLHHLGGNVASATETSGHGCQPIQTVDRDATYKDAIRRKSVALGVDLLKRPGEFLDYGRTLHHLDDFKESNTDDLQCKVDEIDERLKLMPIRQNTTKALKPKHDDKSHEQQKVNVGVDILKRTSFLLLSVSRFKNLSKLKKRESHDLNANLTDGRGSWAEALDTAKMDDEWLQWVRSQFEKVAGEDLEIDKNEFKRALGIKDVSTAII